MSNFGHQLMSVNVDDQLIGIMIAQLQHSFDTFKQSNGEPSSFLSTCKIDHTALIECFYYVASFWMESSSAPPATPGMRALGLCLESGQNWIYALLSCSYVCLKWSALKLRAISSLEGWMDYPQDTLERRVYSALKAIVLLAKCYSIASYLTFIARGDSPSPLYRVSGMRMSTDIEQPGYSSAQLYVESKKALWQAVLGATTAATITIDWQSLRYYYFHFSRMLFRALSGTRSTSSTNSRSTHLSPVSQLDAEGGVLSRDHPHTNNNSEEENDIMKCCSCAHSPAEMPHKFECGHCYCYLCGHSLLHSNNSSIRSRHGGGSDLNPSCECAYCFMRVSSLSPIGN